MLRETLSAREKAASDSWEHYDVRSLLGAVLAAQKRFDEAEALLLAGYQGLTQRAATIPAPDASRAEQAGVRIIRLYQDWR